MTNNLKYLKRKTDWQYDKIQVKSLISILNHTNPLSIENNVFNYNAGLKGIVNIEIGKYPKAEAVVVHDNTFNHNRGLIESNVINIKKRVVDFNSRNSEEVFRK